MKKILAIFILLFMFLLTGCGGKTDSQNSQKTNMFIIIQESSSAYPYKIVYQKDTKVMYAVSNGYYNSGVLTVLVNQDGTPMLYEE